MSALVITTAQVRACAGLFKRRRCGSHLGGKICTSLTYYACAIQQKLIRGAAHARSTIFT